MEIVKLTEYEVKTLIEAIASHCYENCKSEFKNGEKVYLFKFESISEIVDESFFEILTRFAENEDEIYIEETQMEEICKKIEKSLNCEYEVFDKDNFEEASADYKYSRK